MDEHFERELIEKIAVLETKMSQIYNEMYYVRNYGSVSNKDKAIYGALIVAVTTLVNVITEVIQSAI
jgi:carbonic anhydrase